MLYGEMTVRSRASQYCSLKDFWFFPKKAGELLRTELLRGVFRFLPRTLHPAPLQPTPANFGLTEQYWERNGT